jgi:hypothetical protein
MPVIRSSQFKITTIWPELVNKRLQTVTLELSEFQFKGYNTLVSIQGVLQRHVCYYDDDGRNRKARDQLQVELMLDNTGPRIDPELLTMEIQHDYFIFQPRFIGENQAIFEHGFTIIIHQADPKPSQSKSMNPIQTVLANRIVDRGEGATLVKGPVLYSGPGLKPEMVHCGLTFEDIQPLPVVSGVFHGVFSYRTPQNIRLEAECEQPFSFFLDKQINPSQRFQITGQVIDSYWWFDPAGSKWQLELKLGYSWRILHETILNCLSQTGSTPEEPPVKLPVFYQEKRLRFPKIFRIPAMDDGNPSHNHTGEPFELNITNPMLSARLTSKGILLDIKFLGEIYSVDLAGHEYYQSWPVEGMELIGEKWVKELPDTATLALAESRIQLINFSLTDGELRIEIMVECRLNLYIYDWVHLYPVPNPNGHILGRVLKKQKTFLLSSFQAVQLRARPLLIKKLTTSLFTIRSHSKPGWIFIAGEFRLAVAYLDQRHCLREDTFPIFFRETFLWEELQLADKVELACHLTHDSFALHPDRPFRLNYCYWIQATAECIETKEIAVFILQESLRNLKDATPLGLNKETVDDFGHDLPGITNAPFRGIWIPPRTGLELEGEIPIRLGKAREIAGGRFVVSHFSYQNMANLVLVEGRLEGEIEYWDSDGFLRREQAGFTFWKCTRRAPGIEPEQWGRTPGLNRLRLSPVNVPIWRKGRIKIQCVLEMDSDP